MVGRQSPSAWAHVGHSHGDTSEVEDTKPVVAPQDPSDRAHPHPYEQVLARALYIPGFMGSSSRAQAEPMVLAGLDPNLIGEGALLLVAGSPFLLYTARRGWS